MAAAMAQVVVATVGAATAEVALGVTVGKSGELGVSATRAARVAEIGAVKVAVEAPALVAAAAFGAITVEKMGAVRVAGTMIW